MTEIEKMFENANIKQARMCEWTCKGSEDCNLNCEHYGSMQLYYPPFTADKQLELIKWLCKGTYRNYLLIRYNFTNYYWQIECNMSDSDKLDSFVETIASMINNLWQTLTDQEKEEIRGILN